MNIRNLAVFSCLALPALGVTALASGCGQLGAREASPDMAGRDFLLQSAQGAPHLSGARVQLGFSKAELTAYASCNHLFGTYQLDGRRLVLDGVGQTEMGCPSEEHERDAWLAKLLASKPIVELSGATLTLSSGDARLVFIDRVIADPDRPLRTTAWNVGMYLDGDAAIGLANIQAPELVFAEDGSWTLRATCSEGHGEYAVRNGRITIANAEFAEVQSPCQSDNDRQAATLVRDVLRDGELRYRIEAGSLTLEREARGLVLSDAR